MKSKKTSMMAGNLIQLGKSIDLFIAASVDFECHEQLRDGLQVVKKDYESALSFFAEKTSELDSVEADIFDCDDVNVLEGLHKTAVLLSLEVGASVERMIDIHRAANVIYRELMVQ